VEPIRFKRGTGAGGGVKGRVAVAVIWWYSSGCKRRALGRDSLVQDASSIRYNGFYFLFPFLSF
jgi:hypothetical protein